MASSINTTDGLVGSMGGKRQCGREIIAILSFFMVQQAAAKSSKGANKIRKVY